MIAWGVTALKRHDPVVAAAGCSGPASCSPIGPSPHLVLGDGARRRLPGGPHRRAAGCRGVISHPTSAVLRNNLACLLELGGDLAGAEMMLRTALAEDPSLAQVFKNLGDLHYRAGLYDEALEAYERAAKLNPELGDDLYFKLGNIAYKRRDRERARTGWQRVTEINPGHQLARANLDTLDATA